ncbi:MAG TPA: hypothetical protein VIS26_05560 [Candidatus Limnocylindria bacterium]|jgi:hypothetical protein
MDTNRRHTDELLDVARVLLLVQGAVLFATTIEALIWSLIFPGAAGTPFLMSAVAAVLVLVAGARLRADRSWMRRILYVVETVILVNLVIDLALAVVITGHVPPIVALLTRFVLPLAVIGLLRASTRAAVAPVAVSPLEATS